MFMSDHNSIQCILNIPKENCARKEITYRKLKDVDLPQLVKVMSLEEIKTENVDEMVGMLEEKFSTALDTQGPEVTKVITERKKKPWFGDDLKHWKRIVWRREKVYRKYRLESCWIALNIERKKYRKMFFEAKTACYSKQVKDCRGDIKGLYKMVNTLMGTTLDNPLPNHISDKDLAEEFADFFMNKIQKIRDNLDGNSTYEPTKKITSRLTKFRPFDQTEVKKTILSMKSKSCELDALPTRLLKECIEDLLPTITNLVNLSLWDGVFASEWKTSIIRPLLKKPNLDPIPSNYHPVSNLSFLSKLLEKFAMDHVNEHCNLHKLLLDYQSAYRNGYSCETAIIRLVNDILWAMENQNVPAVMALDLSAAFDTVDHEILSSVLEHNFGLDDTMLNWFNSYLNCRSCKVNIGKDYSSSWNLPFSIPQSSFAGAQLFNIYCSSIQDIVNPPLTLHGFADDHTVGNKFKPGDWSDEVRWMEELE